MSKTIEIVDRNEAHIEYLWVKVQGKCGHVWEFNAINGLPDGWYECFVCLTPKYEYKYVPVMVRHPELNHG